ncbi:MAG TPA: sigma-70 family RNA polymerase sigma factor, partial [Gemmata sp.]|nr:sigma-70 family RNA polymerase sigma factor [Gemmata sp.]
MTNLETRGAGVVGEIGRPTDADLLARWCDGRDTAALETLVRRHGKMVLGVARRVLGTSADADDAFQATFLIFIQKARSLARPEQVAGWLHAVAFRVAQKARAKRARRRERESEIVDTVDPANPDPAADTQNIRRTIDAELDRLPEKYRLPIVLCELEGRTLEEAAELLGWPKGTVAGRLSRGRELLRARLSRRGIGMPLFLIMPVPFFEPGSPPDALVSATVASATGGASPAATQTALAEAVLKDGYRRKVGLLVFLLLALSLLSVIGSQAAMALATPAHP